MSEEMEMPDNDEIYLSRKCSDCLHSILRKEGINQFEIYCCFAPASPTKVDSNLWCSYFEMGGSELLQSRKALEDRIVKGDETFFRSI
jgi:hypothetical protein